MRIGLFIADLELSYTATFIYCAREKYFVDFDSSTFYCIIDKLDQLAKNIIENKKTNKKVHWNLRIDDVNKIKALLNIISEGYEQMFGINPSHLKIYDIINFLRAKEQPDPKELAKQVLEEVLTPQAQHNKAPKSRKEKVKEEENLFAKNLCLKLLKNNRK